jgi:hypothetical protein
VHCILLHRGQTFVHTYSSQGTFAMRMFYGESNCKLLFSVSDSQHQGSKFLGYSRHIMTAIATLIQTGIDGDTSWSKEAIVALITMIVMILLSSIGFLWRHRIKTLILIRGRRWFRPAPQGMTQRDRVPDFFNVRCTKSR